MVDATNFNEKLEVMNLFTVTFFPCFLVLLYCPYSPSPLSLIRSAWRVSSTPEWRRLKSISKMKLVG
jgi:hypothetical protein